MSTYAWFCVRSDFTKKIKCIRLHGGVEKQEIYCIAKYFSSKQLIVKFFCKTLIWRKFREKTVVVHYSVFDLHTARQSALFIFHFHGQIRQTKIQYMILPPHSFWRKNKLFLKFRKSLFHFHGKFLKTIF